MNIIIFFLKVLDEFLCIYLCLLVADGTALDLTLSKSIKQSLEVSTDSSVIHHLVRSIKNFCLRMDCRYIFDFIQINILIIIDYILFFYFLKWNNVKWNVEDF